MSMIDAKTMINTHPGRLYKQDFLWNAPVYVNRVTVDFRFLQKTALANLHIHEFVELSIVIAGKGIHQTLLQTAECTVGDVYIINKDASHGYFATPEGDCPTVCNIIFDPMDLFEHEYANPEHSRYCYNVFRKNGLFSYVKLDEQAMIAVNNVVNSMEEELTCRKEEWEQSLKAYVTNLLIMINRFMSNDEVNQPQCSPKDRRVAQSIMRLVLDHYGESALTLEGISKSLFINKVYAGNVFRKVFRINFSDYLQQVRLEKACQLLMETKMTNEQIVTACGLRDVPNFYRQFKRHTGMTPLAFRKSKRDLEKTNIM